MTIQCDVCGLKLQKPGGLLFSPPKKGEVMKYHICLKCWPLAISLIGKLKIGGKRQKRIK